SATANALAADQHRAHSASPGTPARGARVLRTLQARRDQARRRDARSTGQIHRPVAGARRHADGHAGDDATDDEAAPDDPDAGSGDDPDADSGDDPDAD